MKERIKYWDIAKAIGIICVCIGHSGMPSYILTFIMMFHMPLFYFISGALYKDYYSLHPWIRLKKSFLSYYMPFLLFDLTYLLFHNVFAMLHLVDETNGEGFYSLSEYGQHFLQVLLKGHREYFSGALWFLVAIFLITVGFAFGNYIIYKVKLDRYRIPIIVFISSFCFIISKIEQIPKPMIIRRSMGGVFFFVLGYLFQRYDWNKNLLKHKKKTILAAITALCLISWLNEVSFFSYVYNNIIASTVGGILGIGFVIIISQNIVLQQCKLLNLIGKASLIIMATHFLAFKPISYLIMMIYKLPVETMAAYPVVEVKGIWWIVYTISGTLIPTICYYVFLKWKERKKYR
ncbi:Acyltransferase family protein [Clostridiales bacterium CHKCI001]|nr:Acyltransferase family protein [Clostridiales bacterium CHKCI001]